MMKKYLITKKNLNEIKTELSNLLSQSFLRKNTNLILKTIIKLKLSQIHQKINF